MRLGGLNGVDPTATSGQQLRADSSETRPLSFAVAPALHQRASPTGEEMR